MGIPFWESRSGNHVLWYIPVTFSPLLVVLLGYSNFTPQQEVGKGGLTENLVRFEVGSGVAGGEYSLYDELD